MGKKGRMVYIPQDLLGELDIIKKENKIEKNSLALQKMGNYARIGREMDYIYRGEFGKMDIFKKKRRR